jgi:CRP/FNR family cyclic AMP-dependent transcriptional regulator
VAKDIFDPFAEVVPNAIATKGIRGRAAASRRRSDRPLGRQGVDLLAQVPLFSAVPKRALKRLAEHADIVEFDGRETIVETDQPGGTFYVLLEGEAKVIRRNRTVGRLSPGDFFGEMSLLDGGPRSASVVADTPVTAIRIFKRSFDKVVSEQPGVATQILAVLARRLREAERPLSA